MPSKIRDVENKYPAFSITVNLLYYNKQKDKSKIKISEIVRNVFDTKNVAKTDEQTVRNIIESISEFGVDYDKKNYKILTKNEKIAETIVNKSELIDYLFNLVGDYFMANIESRSSFYDEIRFNKRDIVKKTISLYLDYMSFKPEDVCEMTFSDAIADMEQTIFFVSKREEIMSKINDLEVKDLIKEWSKEISKTIDESFNEKPPFVE